MPDDIVVAMVEERLAEDDAAKGAILDGFPRTVAQAKALDSMLAKAGIAVAAVLYIEVPQELLLARLTGRRICTVDDQHVYHVVAMPPTDDGICDIDGAELYQRADDSEETVAEPPRQAAAAHVRGHRLLRRQQRPLLGPRRPGARGRDRGAAPGHRQQDGRLG